MGWHRCSIGRSHVEAHGASRWQSPSIPYPKAKKNTRGGGPSIVAEGVINEKGISRQPPRVGIAQAAQASTPSTSSFPPKIFTFLPSFSPSPLLYFQLLFSYSIANKFCTLFLCRFESYSFVFKQSTTWLRKSGVEAVSLRRSLVKIKFGNRRKNLFVFYRARKYVIVCEK